MTIVPDFPVVQFAAQFFRLIVQKPPLVIGQHDRIDCAKLAPVGPARKQLRIEARRSGVDGLLLRFRNRRKHALHELERRARQHGPADGPPGQKAEDDGRKERDEVDGRHVRAMKIAGEKPKLGGESHRGQPKRPHPERLAPDRQHKHGGERQGEENKAYHGRFLF